LVMNIQITKEFLMWWIFAVLRQYFIKWMLLWINCFMAAVVLFGQYYFYYFVISCRIMLLKTIQAHIYILYCMISCKLIQHDAVSDDTRI
jgi:hypothetical protein